MRSRTVATAIATVILLGGTLGALPSRALADTTSDIPGVPLPGPFVTGQLGGPVYDVVYRLTIPAGYVLTASLTGSSGTLFGLYLFDSTATTVVSNQGLVAESTVAGTAQHISYGSLYGGTYYLDLNGASDVEGAYTLVAQVGASTTPPVASLVLDNGRQYTNSTTVSVILTGSASLSGLAQMAFSSNGEAWGPWQPYAAGSTWTFQPGDGVKTLWAKVRNGVGVESAPASASITLDTVAPVVSSILPTPNSVVDGLRPRITLQFSKPINPASWNSLGLAVQTAGGSPVEGTFTYDPAAMTGSFVPSTDLVPGQTYIVTVGSVVDLAGNVVQPLPPWTITPLQATSLTLVADPRVILPGGHVALKATTPGLATSVVFLQQRSADSTAWTQSGPASVANDAVSTAVQPTANAWYRYLYPGSRSDASTTSNTVRVVVRRLVSLTATSPSATQAAKVGSRVTLTAQVLPVGTPAHVSFQLYRYDAARRAWRYADSFGRWVDAQGQASITWTPSVAGRYYWRVASLPTPEYANNVSPVYRWTVTGR